MKNLKNLIYLLLIFAVSCNSNKKETDGTTETLSIDIEKASVANFSDLFAKMEIVPLETNDESLLGGLLKWYYNEKENGYFSFDIQQKIMHCILSNDDKKSCITLYNKKSKKINSFSSEFSNGITLLQPFWLSNSVWYSYTSASEINSIIDMDYLTAESKLRLSQIQEDDNPVIVKYYLK
jgi:hypothetical protein